MDRKILATKAPTGFVVGEIIGMIVCAIVGIGWLFMGQRFPIMPLFSLIFIVVSVFCGYLAFSNIKNPYEMVYYDEEGIYLNYKNNEFIAFKDMLYVKQKHSRSRYHTYEYGHIEITTKDSKFKIGVIDDIDNVAYIIRSNIDRVVKE